MTCKHKKIIRGQEHYTIEIIKLNENELYNCSQCKKDITKIIMNGVR